MRRIVRTTLSAFCIAMLGGCAAGGGEPNEQLANVLDQLESDTAYASTARCLSSFEYDEVEVLDDKHLLFESSPGGEAWLNTLRAQCPGLRRDDTLLFERTGSRLCNLDTVEVVERFLFWQRTGPVCALGEFQELTEGQAALVKEALQS